MRGVIRKQSLTRDPAARAAMTRELEMRSDYAAGMTLQELESRRGDVIDLMKNNSIQAANIPATAEGTAQTAELAAEERQLRRQLGELDDAIAQVQVESQIRELEGPTAKVSGKAGAAETLVDIFGNFFFGGGDLFVSNMLGVGAMVDDGIVNSLVSIDRGRRGLDGQKCPHISSKLLKIQEVFPASFSLSENISAPSKLLRT